MRKTVLALACVLLAPMLLVGITSSAPYDPWYDLNESGRIDIFDVVMLAGTYGTSGDPGKNVNVTNWPPNVNVTIARRANKLAYTLFTNMEAGASFTSPWISVDGYSKVTICLYTSANNNNYWLETRHYGGSYFYVDIQTDFGTDLVKTYDVPNEEIRIVFFNYEATTRPLGLDVYVIP